MPIVTNKPFMLIVTNKLFMLIVVMLNVFMLNFVAPIGRMIRTFPPVKYEAFKRGTNQTALPSSLSMLKPNLKQVPISQDFNRYFPSFFEKIYNPKHFSLLCPSIIYFPPLIKKVYYPKTGHQCLQRDMLAPQLPFFVGWHASAFSLPPGDVIFDQLACLLNDVIFLFTLGITNLSLYKHR